LVKPYIDQFEEDGSRIRTFSSDIDSDELIWHRDKKDREITILSGVGWKLQMEDKLPKELELGKLYDIPKEEYHRIIKGKDNLVIRIWENGE
jgi:hypothetical protein